MTIPTKPDRPETQAETMARWLSDGETWIGVFENHDLGHPEAGRRVALPFDNAIKDASQLGMRAPDHAAIGLGWRWVLIAKCETATEALATLLEGEPSASRGSSGNAVS